MQPPTTPAMYRNTIVTPDGEFGFNKSDLIVPFLTEPHVNNSKNHIPIRSSVYNKLMFYPSGEINKQYKKTTFKGYGLRLGVVREKIFEQFIENSINILPPAERPTARANFEIYDKKYRELLQRYRSRSITQQKPTYINNVPVGGKRKRT